MLTSTDNIPLSLTEHSPAPLHRGRHLEALLSDWNEYLTPNLREQWNRLTDSGASAEPFFKPVWFDVFRSTLAKQRKALLLSVFDASGMVGILPLLRTNTYFRGLPARTLRSMSNIHSCRFDFVAERERVEEITAVAWERLRDSSVWDVIEALDVPEGGNFQWLQEHARRDGYLIGRWPTRKMPYIPLSRDPDSPFEYCPEAFKGSRSRLKSKMKKLASHGKVTFSTFHPSSNDESILEFVKKFVALEAAGWKGTNGSAIACSPELVEYYSRIAEAAAELDILHSYGMFLDGQPIALHFGLLMNDRYYIPKVTYDETFKKYSPGLLLVKHAVEDLTKRGARCFDFLGPRMEWKSVWTSHYRQHSDCFIYRPTLRGRILHRLVDTVAPRLRNLKHRYRGDPQAA